MHVVKVKVNGGIEVIVEVQSSIALRGGPFCIVSILTILFLNWIMGFLFRPLAFMDVKFAM